MTQNIEQAAREYSELLPQGRVSRKYSAIDFTAGAKWALTHQWISVEDGLPQHKPIGQNQRFSETVFLRNKNGDCSVDSFDFEMPDTNITHWMKIPPIEGDE